MTGRLIAASIALMLATALAAPAQQLLHARVDITRESHRLKDASQAVIWLTPVGTQVERVQQDPAHIPALVQRDKKFHPGLLVIPVGGKVEFPNDDPFFHNVFSMFEGKRFDLGLYETGTTRFVQFDKPGISFIFCNIHSQMNAVVIALATPYYGISDTHGELSIRDVPPGRYQIQVFHSAVAPDALKAFTKEITIAPGEDSLGTFTLSETDVLVAHKNKYGKDYDRPEPDSPAYSRP